MGMVIGPTAWWQSNLVKNSPVGSTLPDGSRIICKNGGTAWIVAPACTEVGSTWANSAIVGSVIGGDLPSVSCWATLCNRLIACGFNPSDWFVPSCLQLLNPGYLCRTQWDSFSSTPGCYWSSTECGTANAYMGNMSGYFTYVAKSTVNCVRAFRCVTY